MQNRHIADYRRHGLQIRANLDIYTQAELKFLKDCWGYDPADLKVDDQGRPLKDHD